MVTLQSKILAKQSSMAESPLAPKAQGATAPATKAASKQDTETSPQNALDQKMMHLRGTVGAGKLTGRADKNQAPNRSQHTLLEQSPETQKLQTELRRSRLESLIQGSTNAGFTHNAKGTGADPSTKMGQVLGKESANTAEGAGKSTEILDELSGVDRDDVAL